MVWNFNNDMPIYAQLVSQVKFAIASGELLPGDRMQTVREMALEAFRAHPRIRCVTIDEGFKGNASLFKYARDLGNRRGDMYEIGLWEDSIVESGNDIMYAINIPQESVTIPETIDGIRAAMKMQATREEATAKTNEYLKIGRFKKLAKEGSRSGEAGCARRVPPSVCGQRRRKA